MALNMALTRIVIAGFGLAALLWALLALGTFQAAAPFEGLARQIVAGEAFIDDALARAAARLDAARPDAAATPRVDYAALLRADAILRLRLVESALDRADPAVLDARMAALRGAIEAALAAAPGDPFLWLTRYWLDNTQNGFSPDHLALLAASYAFGPREGWIAARRDRLALAVFAQLDAATQQRVVEEFAAMVDSRFTPEAADNLAGPGWPLRDRLVAGLKGVDPAAKQTFAKYLRDQGIKLDIPGVPDLGDRLWR